MFDLRIRVIFCWNLSDISHLSVIARLNPPFEKSQWLPDGCSLTIVPHCWQEKTGPGAIGWIRWSTFTLAQDSVGTEVKAVEKENPSTKGISYSLFRSPHNAPWSDHSGKVSGRDSTQLPFFDFGNLSRSPLMECLSSPSRLCWVSAAVDILCAIETVALS